MSDPIGYMTRAARAMATVFFLVTAAIAWAPELHT